MAHVNPDERRAYQRKYRAGNPGVHAKWMLKHRYGMTVEDLRSLFEQQEGLCAVCSGAICICTYAGSKECTDKALVDHNHDTGKVRGLLCYACNTAIGKLGDSARGVRNALLYLEAC